MDERTDGLLAQLTQTNELLRAQLKLVKIIALALAVLVAVLTVFAVFAGVRLGAACDALGSVDWPALSRKLSALDIESANDTLASLQKAADALAQLTGRLNTLFGARG